MSERKVLNKYYPPDFDPSKIPKLRLPRNRQYSIRIMAPFNMRCSHCGEYIYKGKKFNSRKETVETEDYLGLRIFRFYIKCPRCVSEIAFKTDPQNTDYSLEDGATRNFEAAKTAEVLARKAIAEIEEEELNNPMKVLENRTKASQQEMDMLEKLEELKEMNSKHAQVDFKSMLQVYRNYEDQLKALQEEEEEDIIKEIFGKKDGASVKRLHDDDDDDEDDGGDDDKPSGSKVAKPDKPTDFLTEATSSKEDKKQEKRPSWLKSIGSSGMMSSKAKLSMLVRKKTPAKDSPGDKQEKAGDKQEKTGDKQEKTGDKQEKAESQTETVPVQSVSQSSVGSERKDLPASGDNVDKGATKADVKTSNVPSGLGLLGAYSDSESNSD